MDRHFLVQTLFDRISDKSKILLAKRVSRIDHSHDCVSVQCRDGATYTGNVVVGADGVHSIVRNEMWRHMSVADPTSLKKNERTCKFGLADNPAMLIESSDVRRLRLHVRSVETDQEYGNRNFRPGRGQRPLLFAQR